jgi:hypothetical protein
MHIGGRIKNFNAWKEKLVYIWFVYRIWEFEVNYGDFISVTCILNVDLVGNFKFAVRI